MKKGLTKRPGVGMCFGHYMVPRIACWYCPDRDECIKELRKKLKEARP